MRNHDEVTRRLIERRSNANQIKKAPNYSKIIPIAACLLLIIAAIPTAFYISKRSDVKATGDDTAAIQPGKNLDAWQDAREKNDKTAALQEIGDIEYPWEYLTDSEKYISVKYVGDEYTGRGLSIKRGYLGKKLEDATVLGYDNIKGKQYSRKCDIYEISGVNPKYLIAVSVNQDKNDFCVFVNSNYNPPSTLGNFIKDYGLENNLKLTQVYDENDRTYSLSDECSARIWKMISQYPSTDFDEGNDNEAQYSDKFVGFSASSEQLGISNKSFKIMSTGYIWTNIGEYLYCFNIGKDAANEIIEYVEANRTPCELIPQYYTLAGTVTEISDEYIKIDDSVTLKNPNEGIEFTVSRADIRFSRAFSIDRIKVGDTVVIYLSEKILADSDGNPKTVDGAYEVHKAMLEGDKYLIPE